MQDWTTVRGSSSVITFTPGEDNWVDLGEYKDVVAWLEVKEFTPAPGASTLVLAYETAPTKDDALFTAITGVAISVGVNVTPIIRDCVTVPPARWFRWELGLFGTAAAWDVTFRIVLAVNSG
jgi:hypothetical protein